MGRIKSEAGVGGLKRGPKSKTKIEVVKTGFDGPSEAPWRRTATIFKQPITLVHTTKQGTTETPVDKLKKYPNVQTERPMPLFWTKCFEKTSPMVSIHKCDKTLKELIERPDEYIRLRTSLPDGVAPYCSIVKPEESLISYVSALTPSTPSANGIIGQKETNPQKRCNPFYNANPEQPLVVVRLLHNIFSLLITVLGNYKSDQ